MSLSPGLFFPVSLLSRVLPPSPHTSANRVENQEKKIKDVKILKNLDFLTPLEMGHTHYNYGYKIKASRFSNLYLSL